MYVSNLLILMSACCEETHYFFFPQFGRAMSTVQLWMEIRNVLWVVAKKNNNRINKLKKMGTHVKTRRCQVQINNVPRIRGCLWKHFRADELRYPKSIKEEYHSAWISTYIFDLRQSVHCLWIEILSWAVDQWAKDLWRFMDVKAPTAVDYEWWANFGKQESVCIVFFNSNELYIFVMHI